LNEKHANHATNKHDAADEAASMHPVRSAHQSSEQLQREGLSEGFDPAQQESGRAASIDQGNKP
jgi:hypothetical protein